MELSGSAHRMSLWRRCDAFDSKNGAARAPAAANEETFVNALDGLRAAIVQAVADVALGSHRDFVI